MLYPDEQISSARETLGTLWPALKGGLWHSTPLACYTSILEDREIRPDGGQCGNVYQGSYAFYVNGISLFDFESASEDEALGTFDRWWSGVLWRRDDGALTVWIRLKRDLLPGRLLLPAEVRECATAATKNWYPRVEACHIGPIPVDAFDGVLAVSTTTPLQFASLAMGEAALPHLSELDEQWRKPPEENDLLIERFRAERVAANSRLSERK